MSFMFFDDTAPVPPTDMADTKFHNTSSFLPCLITFPF